MIIKKLIKKAPNKFLKYKTKFKAFVLLISFLFLIPDLQPNKLKSYESCFDLLNEEKKEYLLKRPKPFNKVKLTANDTILLIVPLEEVGYFKKKCEFLKIRSKNIKVVNKEQKGIYFLKIFIEPSEYSRVIINHFSFILNSEILFIATKLFGFENSFNVLKIENSWENKIKFKLSLIDIDKFLFFLRICSNFHSHFYNFYFYIPVKVCGSDYTINLTGRIIFFNLIIFLLLFLDSLDSLNSLDLNLNSDSDLNIIYEKKEINISPFLIVNVFIIYTFINPFIFIFCFKKKYAVYFSFIFLISNFKFGLFYNLGWYIYFLKDLLKRNYNLKCKVKE